MENDMCIISMAKVLIAIDAVVQEAQPAISVMAPVHKQQEKNVLPVTDQGARNDDSNSRHS